MEIIPIPLITNQLRYFIYKLIGRNPSQLEVNRERGDSLQNFRRGAACMRRQLVGGESVIEGKNHIPDVEQEGVRHEGTGSLAPMRRIASALCPPRAPATSSDGHSLAALGRLVNGVDEDRKS